MYSSLRKHPFLLVLSDEERGETDVFAGYMYSHTLEVCWEVALRDEKNKMAARETSNTHTNIIRNKNKTDKYTVTVYRTQGKSILLLSSVCTCHFHLLYQSSS